MRVYVHGDQGEPEVAVSELAKLVREWLDEADEFDVVVGYRDENGDQEVPSGGRTVVSDTDGE